MCIRDRFWVIHPWVIFYFFDCRPALAIIAKYFCYEVLEVMREVLTSNLPPVFIVLFVMEKRKEIFVFFGFFEGKDAHDYYEENDSNGEHICLLSIVNDSFLDLWSHVGHRAFIGFELAYVFVLREAEVGHLYAQLFIEQNIFELQVTVHYITLMHVT